MTATIYANPDLFKLYTALLTVPAGARLFREMAPGTSFAPDGGVWQGGGVNGGGLWVFPEGAAGLSLVVEPDTERRGVWARFSERMRTGGGGSGPAGPAGPVGPQGEPSRFAYEMAYHAGVITPTTGSGGFGVAWQTYGGDPPAGLGLFAPAGPPAPYPGELVRVVIRASSWDDWGDVAGLTVVPILDGVAVPGASKSVPTGSPDIAPTVLAWNTGDVTFTVGQRRALRVEVTPATEGQVEFSLTSVWRVAT